MSEPDYGDPGDEQPEEKLEPTSEEPKPGGWPMHLVIPEDARHPKDWKIS